MVTCQPSYGSSAQPAAKTVLDIRGSWKMVAVANGVNYPQTMDITTEDRSTGALAGIDVGAGQTFTVTGTVSSTGTTFKTTGGGGYTSNSAAKISGSGVALTMNGPVHGFQPHERNLHRHTHLVGWLVGPGL